MQHVEVHGARLAYRDTGPQDAPTLVLLHGFPLSSAMWGGVIDHLGDGCRMVAPDLRGFGLSGLGAWPGAREGASLDRYADDLAELLDRIAPTRPVTLAGFSMGGYVALAMLRRHPGVFDRLALLDTRAAADDEAGRATRLKMAAGVAEWGAARVAEMMRPKLFAPATPQEVVAETVAVIAATQPAAIAAAQRAMAARPDSRPLLATIDKATLVLVGSEDAISHPAEMRDIAAAIPGARFVEVAGAGHMAPVERPAEVAAALLEMATG